MHFEAVVATDMDGQSVPLCASERTLTVKAFLRR
jgi:hypothetical protein